ncbi:MAG TPA: YkvA family protein [Anaerolineales bacterium]|nr:YkvA family protein [Anaerolineales bacterium]
MTDKKPSDLIVSQQGGVVRNVLNQLKLIFRLMGDSRVNIFAKLIPIGALIYLVSPDPIMIPIIGVVDDAALLWLGSYVFTELCPPAVVAEHMKELAGNMDAEETQAEIVDAEATDVSDKPVE